MGVAVGSDLTIKQVRVSVIALIPPSQGIRATLGNHGISRVVIPNDAGGFQDKISSNARKITASSGGCGVNWRFRPLLAPPGARFSVAQHAQRDDPGLATTRNPGNVGLNASTLVGI